MSKYFFFLFIIFSGFTLSQSSENFLSEAEQKKSIIFKDLRHLITPKDFQERLNLRLVNKDFNTTIQSLFTWKEIALNLRAKNTLEEYLALENTYRLPNVLFKVDFSLTKTQMKRFCKIFPKPQHLHLYPSPEAKTILIDLPFMRLLNKNSIAFMQKGSKEGEETKIYTKRIFKPDFEKKVFNITSEKLSEKLTHILKNLQFYLYGVQKSYLYYSYIPSRYYLNLIQKIKFYEDQQSFLLNYDTSEESLRQWQKKKQEYEILKISLKEYEERSEEEGGEINIKIELKIKAQPKKAKILYDKALNELKKNEKLLLQKIINEFQKNNPKFKIAF